MPARHRLTANFVFRWREELPLAVAAKAVPLALQHEADAKRRIAIAKAAKSQLVPAGSQRDRAIANP